MSSIAGSDAMALPRAEASGVADGAWPFMVAAALPALAITLVVGWLQSVPNPDALYYLTAADHFARGEWHEGFAVYRWPLYSLQIAGVVVVTGLQAFPAAVAVDAAYTAGLAAVFVYLIALVSGRDRAAMVIAALLIVFDGRLTYWAGNVIRDHGYWFFLMAAIATVVADGRAPGVGKKILLVVEIGLATLCRIEGAYLIVLAPGFMLWTRARTTAARFAVPAAIGVISLAGLAGFTLWTGGGLGMLDDLGGPIARRVALMDASLIDPIYADGRVWYAGMAVATLIAALLRAYTLVFSGLGIAAYFPRRLVPPEASRVFLWFALGQLPALAIFATLQLFLPWRYAMGMALVGLIPIVFVLRAGYAEWRERRRRAYILMPLSIALIAIGFIGDLPAPTDIGYLRDAGLWVRTHAEKDAYVWIGEPRILYYSGWTQGVQASTPFSQRARLLDRPNSYFVIDRRPAAPLPDWLATMPGRRLVQGFPGRNGDVAEIYVRCPESRYCRDGSAGTATPPQAGTE